MIEVSLASQLATMRRIYEKRGHLAKAINFDKSPSPGQLELLERDLNAIMRTLEWIDRNQARIRFEYGSEAKP